MKFYLNLLTCSGMHAAAASDRSKGHETSDSENGMLRATGAAWAVAAWHSNARPLPTWVSGSKPSVHRPNHQSTGHKSRPRTETHTRHWMLLLLRA